MSETLPSHAYISEEPEPSTIEILISGRVQGVGFRACIRKIALNLGISGEVMNLNDGRVLIYAISDQPILEKMVSMLYGCPRAVVRECMIREINTKKYTGFSVNKGVFQYRN